VAGGVVSLARTIRRSCAALLLAPAFCGGAAAETALRIGHVETLEPFASVTNGKSTGMIVEIVAAALGRAKIAHGFVPLRLDRMEGELATGTIAALAFVGGTPDKRAAMDLSGPIVMTGGALFVPAASPPATLKDLAGKTLVTPRAGPLGGQLSRMVPEVKLVLSTDYGESFDLVLAGKADAAALNFHAGIRLARAKYAGKFRLPEQPIVAVPMMFAVRKGERAELLKIFDRQLAAMRADGALAAIERRWLGE
jgi:ABC-type amino acid transport substrate-binding protein